MSKKKTIAIVGGGIGGLYAARELRRSADVERIVVFEFLDRLGGRIETLRFDGGEVAEFGPMRFELALQPLLCGLLNDLNMQGKVHDAANYGPEASAIAWPAYELRSSEKWKGDPLSALDLLRLGILRIFADVIPGAPPAKDMRPSDVFEEKDPAASGGSAGTGGRAAPALILAPLYQDWLHKVFAGDHEQLDGLREAKLYGTPVQQLGLWNALEWVLSHQAVLKVRDIGTFYHLITTNPSALEWGIFWLRYFAILDRQQIGRTSLKDRPPFKEVLQEFPDGVGELVESLVKDLKRGSGPGAGVPVEFRMANEVTGLRRRQDAPRLVLDVRDHGRAGGPRYEFLADHAVLALPAGAIARLDADFPEEVRRHLRSVVGFPLVKAVLLTRNPWWKGNLAQAGAGYLPTREVHYRRRPAKGGRASGQDPRGLAMVYTDDPAAEFWRAFLPDTPHTSADIYLAKGTAAHRLGAFSVAGDRDAVGTTGRDVSSGHGAHGTSGNTLLKRTLSRYVIDDARRQFDSPTLRAILDAVAKVVGDKRGGDIITNIKATPPDQQVFKLLDSLTADETDKLIETARQALAGTDPETIAKLDILRRHEALWQDEERQIAAYAIRDWTQAPFYAGCHAWRPGARADEALIRLSAFPLTGGTTANVHICGEAYSDYQGFIEGALRTAKAAAEAISM